jgi:hypothetical protein
MPVVRVHPRQWTNDQRDGSGLLSRVRRLSDATTNDERDTGHRRTGFGGLDCDLHYAYRLAVVL